MIAQTAAPAEMLVLEVKFARVGFALRIVPKVHPRIAVTRAPIYKIIPIIAVLAGLSAIPLKFVRKAFVCVALGKSFVIESAQTYKPIPRIAVVAVMLVLQDRLAPLVSANNPLPVFWDRKSFGERAGYSVKKEGRGIGRGRSLRSVRWIVFR